MNPKLEDRPPNTKFILRHLGANIVPSPQELHQETTLEPTLLFDPTPRWLIGLNFVLFCALLVTGVLWIDNFQENRVLQPPEVTIND